jgi:hypothetical protein
MVDIEIILENKPGTLAKMGEVLGAAGVSLEGGGAFVYNGLGIAHFLVEDGVRARTVLEANGIRVNAIHEVLIQKLKQDVPGQLGMICRLMEQHGVNILVQYSDHANQLILVVDDLEKGKKVSAAWTGEMGV